VLNDLKRTRDTIEEEIATFRNEINRETMASIRSKKRRSRIWHMDEAAIYDDNVVSRSYSPVGNSPYVKCPNTHRRDTIIVCVADDGTKLPLIFLEHKPKKYSQQTNQITGASQRLITDKGISGISTAIYLEWIENVFWDRTLPEGSRPEAGDTLCLDALALHSHPQAASFLSSVQVALKIFPVGGAPSLSMCDNSLFRDLKVDYKKKLNQLPSYPTFTVEDKKKVIEDCWTVFPASRICGYWRKCQYDVRAVKKTKDLSNGRKKKKAGTGNQTRIIDHFGI